MRSLQRQCLGALSERLYRLLIGMASSQPQRAAELFAAISAEALLYLDESVLDRLNADFLTALLSKAAHLWRDYENLIRKTIESPDPLPVVKLLQLFEQTSDADLQAFMAGSLLHRAGVSATDQHGCGHRRRSASSAGRESRGQRGGSVELALAVRTNGAGRTAVRCGA